MRINYVHGRCKKTPSELTCEDVMGKLFKSYEMAGLFFPLYAKSMGFCVRIGKMRKIVLEKLRIDLVMLERG